MFTHTTMIIDPRSFLNILLIAELPSSPRAAERSPITVEKDNHAYLEIEIAYIQYFVVIKASGKEHEGCALLTAYDKIAQKFGHSPKIG